MLNFSYPSRTKPRALFLALPLAIALAGCAEQDGSGSLSASAPAVESAASGAVSSGSDPAPNAKTDSPTAQLIQLASAAPRRIIYTATVDLIADDFASSQRQLLGLISKNRGYIAETNIGAAPGSPRLGTWKIRVPEAQFSAFMSAIVKIGELQTTRTESQDVTAEFTDLEARIGNKGVEEKRLIAHLQRSTAKLSEILQVERELSRVRGEIEQMQGRLRLLANQSALTTITVTLREVKGYVAPQPTSFGSEITRTFQASLGSLGDLGKFIVLLGVGSLPWLVLLGVFGLPLWAFVRRQNKNL